MYKNLLNGLLLTLPLLACNESKPTISVVCEENKVGNCIVKWEVAPLITGEVKVYASTNPDLIPEERAVAMGKISDERMTIINDDPLHRYYYLLVFNDKYRVRVATRNVNIPGIQNFRDLGGYKSSDKGLLTRYGMLYRSAQVDSLSSAAREELHQLNIQTIIDLRSNEEVKNQKPLQSDFRVVHIPICIGNISHLLQEVQTGKIRQDSICEAIEEVNRKLMTCCKREFRQMFDLLLDRKNYPMIIHCASGKERTGVASALILASLGVNDDIIMADYQLSNQFFNLSNLSKEAHRLPATMQETITTLFSARENFLNAAKDEAERLYGDIPTYLEKGIGLTRSEIEQLREIMLHK